MIKLPKRNKSNRFLIDAAKFVINSGVSIDWGSNCDDWVCISAPDEDDIFMQGDSAREFMDEMEAIERRFRSFDSYTAALVVAKPYVECIWG